MDFQTKIPVDMSGDLQSDFLEAKLKNVMSIRYEKGEEDQPDK